MTGKPYWDEWLARAMDFPYLLEMLGTVATAMVSVGGALAVVVAFFRKRIRRWWQPYGDGLRGAARVPVLEAAIGEMRGSLGLLHLRISARANHSDTAECDFDPMLRMTNVNAALARRLGVGKVELLGYAYRGFIHPADRQRFADEWRQCADEHRIFEWAGRWESATGQTVPMEWVMTPIPEPPEQGIQQWLGVGEFDPDNDPAR